MFHYSPVIMPFTLYKVKACVQASSVRERKESLNSQLLLETYHCADVLVEADVIGM
jgi:hypothetical protein